MNLEPLEARELLAGLNPAPVLPATPPAQGSADPARIDQAPGAQDSSRGSGGTTAGGGSHPSADTGTAARDPTPGDDYPVSGGLTAGRAQATQSYGASAGSPGTVDRALLYAAQQEQPGAAASYRAAPYASYAAGTSGFSERLATGPGLPLAALAPPSAANPQPPGTIAAAPPLGPPPSLSAEAAEGIAGPVLASFYPSSGPGSGGFDSTLPGEPLTGAAPKVGEEALEPRITPADILFSGLAPQLGSLLAGTLPIHLPALERAADAFFVRMERLAEVVTLSEAPRLFPWLAAAAVAAGTYEFVRRRARPGRGGRRTPTWAPFPVLAVLPAED